MAKVSNKNTFARTYSRHSKPKEVLVPSTGEIPVEYENACRLCLEKADVMVDIFRYEDNLIPIVEKITSIIALEVKEDDELPKLICDLCLIQLNRAYTFKKRCLASNVKLRQFLYDRGLPKGRSCLRTVESRKEDGLYLVEERSSPDNNKGSCTIDWNDQVPLATIIEYLPNVKSDNQPNEISGSNKGVCQVDEPIRVDAEVQDEESSDSADLPFDYQTYSQEDLMSEEEELLPSKEPNLTAFTDPPKKQFGRFHPKSQTVRDEDKATQKAQNLLKEVQQSPVPAQIKRTLKVVDVEDVPLATRLNLEKGKQAKEVSPDVPTIAVPVIDKCKFFCRRCKHGVVTKEDLKAHRSKCDLALKCSVCSKKCASKSLLERHMRVHTGERPFQCEKCDMSFSQREILVRHNVQKHVAEKPYVCEICQKGFGLYRLLVTHYKLSHDNSRVYRCVHCPKVFQHPSGLSRHQQFHKGTKFFCKVCFKDFSDMSSVKRHLRQCHTILNDRELAEVADRAIEIEESETYIIKNLTK